MCIYGYSLTSFIPITAVCFIKSWLIQSILLLLAFSFSSIFLIRGIFRYLYFKIVWVVLWGKERKECLLCLYWEFNCF